MAITVDAKGNIVFTPDDIPAEIPSDELIAPLPKSDSQESETESPVVIPEPAAPVLKVVDTRIYNNYKDYTVEDLGILFYNREKTRCADADDESLLRMLKEQAIMMEMCRGRERAISDEINNRKTKRFRKDRDSLISDANYKPQTRLQVAARNEAANTANAAKNKRQTAIDMLMNTLGMSKDEAEEYYTKKKV